MKSPFLKKAPQGWPADEIEDFVVEDRLAAIRNFDAEKLRAVIAWPGTQRTVKKAAESRLRRLEKEGLAQRRRDAEEGFNKKCEMSSESKRLRRAGVRFRWEGGV